MLNMQLKQAETAFADGRLDEACQLAARSEIREHKSGQKLIGRIVTALLKRGEEHLANQRIDEAGRDCRAADRLAGNKPEIAELRKQLNAKLKANAIHQQQREQVVRAARQEFDRGALSLGGRMLEQFDGDTQAGAVARELRLRRESADATVKRAEVAIKQSVFEAAVRELADLRRNFPNHPCFDELVNQFSIGAGKQLQDYLDAGRLDRARMLLQRTGSLVECSCQLAEVAASMEQFELAAAAYQSGRYRETANTLARMATIFPKARWIAAALKDAKSAADASEALDAGPLGMLDSGQPGISAAMNHSAKAKQRPVMGAIPGGAPAAGHISNSDRALLSIEGVGSYLVLRNPIVRIGSGSSSRTNDIGLVNAGTNATLTIERVQGDYFLRSEDPVAVNDRQTREKLLTTGDRISLNRRCGLKFILPNPASTTAVLELTTAKLKRPEIRRVILWDDSIVMDQSRAAHVQLQQADPPVVIVARNGSLIARPMGRGVTADQVQNIVHGEIVVVGSTSFSISPVDQGIC